MSKMSKMSEAMCDIVIIGFMATIYPSFNIRLPGVKAWRLIRRPVIPHKTDLFTGQRRRGLAGMDRAWCPG